MPLLVALLLFVLPARAEEIRSAYEGWSIAVPTGWKHMEQGGKYAFGHDSEAGLILLWYTPGVTYEQMEADANRGLSEQGLVLMPAAPASPFSSKAGKALQVDLVGNAADGTRIQTHGVAVAGPAGGLAVMGLTTPEQMPALARRVDEMALSVAFFTAEKRPGGDVAALSGAICAWSGGDSYSSTQKMTFDGKGAVGWGSEFAASGSFKEADGSYAGGWGAATGNQNATSDVGSYTVQGDAVEIRWGDGSAMSCSVHHRNGTRIAELMCGKKLWGAALCG